MSNTFNMNIALDADSLGRLRAFANYERALEPALLVAMEASTSMLQAFAADYMDSHFQNPTGQLAGSMQSQVVSPYEGWVRTEEPYGRRRNWGFSGMTDALGRFYPNDPGIEWAEQTVILEQYKVQDRFQAAVDYANLTLARGIP